MPHYSTSPRLQVFAPSDDEQAVAKLDTAIEKIEKLTILEKKKAHLEVLRDLLADPSVRAQIRDGLHAGLLRAMLADQCGDEVVIAGRIQQRVAHEQAARCLTIDADHKALAIHGGAPPNTYALPSYAVALHPDTQARLDALHEKIDDLGKRVAPEFQDVALAEGLGNKDAKL